MDGDDQVRGEEEWLDVACPLNFVSAYDFDETAICISFQDHAILQNLWLTNDLLKIFFLNCRRLHDKIKKI